MMHGPEKSDPGIVAMKPANKTEQSVAEPNVEGYMHGRADRERPDDPAWSQTLACAEASCTGTGRSHGRPATLVMRAALVRIGKARSRSR